MPKIVYAQIVQFLR